MKIPKSRSSTKFKLVAMLFMLLDWCSQFGVAIPYLDGFLPKWFLLLLSILSVVGSIVSSYVSQKFKKE